MSELSSVTVNDGESTPVAHTFTPENVDAKGVGYLVERGSYALADNVATVSNLKQPNGAYRGRLVLNMPIVVEETINGVTVPSVARELKAEMKILAPADSSEQELKNLLRLMSNLFDGSVTFINDTFEGRTGVY